MEKSEVLNSLQEMGLVPVLRAHSFEEAMALSGAIAAGGIKVLEITMTVPGAMQVIRRLVEERPDILIGGWHGTRSRNSTSLHSRGCEICR